ncbi:hypothetical protein RSOLAG1IB_07798 [Rhizoctonia solani AG-1 IB]|uniref:Uncharacterized protein n=1 Tax=Thanatephorus cucumeris (strain AG1-IB / isolate 7/3/14) TaxID=1108050 RepID=A0A0B7FJR2_THACB|nr:hypothetical protein RSOLAG1IB_07798 [Rhizoctonia solani AG-1 IB]
MIYRQTFSARRRCAPFGAKEKPGPLSEAPKVQQKLRTEKPDSSLQNASVNASLNGTSAGSMEESKAVQRVLDG